MAHKKGVGSTDNGRDSNSKRLGVKLFGGQYAKAGNIIIRQRGTKYHPGLNVYLGKDFTVHAKIEGTVYFTKKKGNRTVVNIRPLGEVAETIAPMGKKAAPKKAAPKAAAPKAAPAPKAEAPVAAAKPAAALKSTGKPDDLKKIEGIGPKIAEHLGAAGILTFADLAGSSQEAIKEVLTKAGPRYAIHNPTTWPMQAGLAADGKWDELKKWQDESDGGKPITSSEEE